MYSVSFHGFKTAKQAEVFAAWYSGQGEQDIDIWLEESNCGATAMLERSTKWDEDCKQINIELEIHED